MGFWQNQLDTLTANGNEKVEELERQLAAANQEIERLKTTVAQQHAVSTQIGAIPEDDLLRRREMNGSTAVSQMGHNKRPSVLRSGSSSSEQSHGKSPTLSELLYTSQFGD